MRSAHLQPCPALFGWNLATNTEKKEHAAWCRTKQQQAESTSSACLFWDLKDLKGKAIPIGPSGLYGGATFPISTGIPPSSRTTPDAPDCDPVSLQNSKSCGMPLCQNRLCFRTICSSWSMTMGQCCRDVPWQGLAMECAETLGIFIAWHDLAYSNCCFENIVLSTHACK